MAATTALFFALFSGPASAVTLAEALSAYRNNQVADAERMLGEVAADPAASTGWRAARRTPPLARSQKPRPAKAFAPS
jgi:hypothetical protein